MLIGKRISGRYKILEMIGGGGMANVYLAHDMILDRDVAVKMLRLDFANDEEFIRRFHREAQSATSLAHSNIVNIYDVGEEQDIYYIVMEYVAGQTLKQYIQQNSPIQVETALSIMRQLTSAISHAHNNNIVHRDIKPHNILMDREGKVKITDFGIAMALSATSITQTNSVLGSVHYLSPEQARGGMANKKSDIYSLGIVMFELLTGRLPFSGESAVSIALKHLQSETPSVRRWNPDVPQSVENIVLKATAKDQFNRYASVDEMEEDIRTALDPKRLYEPKFSVPIDDEATKAIPIITNDRAFQNFDETVVHSQGKQNGNQTENDVKKEHMAAKNTKDKPKRKKWPIILVSTFFVIALLGILTITVLPDFLSPKDVPIPDVSGKSLDAAYEELLSAGFKIGETKDIPDAEIKEGLVVKTDPKAGRSAKEGSKINVYKSSGKEKIEMDDYLDRQYEDIEKLLTDKNFEYIETEEVYDDSEPGTILEQDPAPGEEVVPEETTVRFTISKGPETITLKSLKDYTAKGVQDYAESVGLNADVSKEEYHDTIPEGIVISQEPDAGTQMNKGDMISVVISKGKKEVPPKEVTREVIIEYAPAIAGQPQEVQILIDDLDRSMTVPDETFYITQTTKRTIKLRIPYGGQAGYKVIRDSSVIIDEVEEYPREE
ncbi:MULTISPECIES: Stk1 family PASTA domain-containing Ser/Thr kinase [unclassified Bacillus (in: firmicutes)]|uniref:Stk1 family PASTA domain-containing Ser/Thr kinase n=1 Tax=unclassified Bacillus (in: firmicutes) TaxID=185979 RepID=UPI0008E830C6|nr:MULTISPECIES: Stk1 family PASTA domain-containing Ser/Thr kinase [unclassified Bacillus (in: firmicutes)]SFA74830.1 serine/threonine protein kinase [Bacillus sp. UNCCL13]SFQ64928.1 serine/threonine protein kinase [Bacillus sp. cl95]